MSQAVSKPQVKPVKYFMECKFPEYSAEWFQQKYHLRKTPTVFLESLDRVLSDRLKYIKPSSRSATEKVKLRDRWIKAVGRFSFSFNRDKDLICVGQYHDNLKFEPWYDFGHQLIRIKLAPQKPCGHKITRIAIDIGQVFDGIPLNYKAARLKHSTSPEDILLFKRIKLAEDAADLINGLLIYLSSVENCLSVEYCFCRDENSGVWVVRPKDDDNDTDIVIDMGENLCRSISITPALEGSFFIEETDV